MPGALAELSSGAAGPHRIRSHEVRLAVRVWTFAAAARPSDDDGALRVDPDGRSFAPPHAAPIGCERWDALRGVLARLAEECLFRPGSPVPWRELFQAGWPGQNILDSAARNRLKVAVATLRKLGLGSHVRHAATATSSTPRSA